MNLTNDTYIQRTLKGDKALLQKPPIPFKLRALLHEIPQLGKKDFFLRKDLLKVSDLYVKSNSDDPIGFFKQINDVFEKGWIDVVSDEEIEPLIIDEDVKKEDNVFLHSNHIDSYQEDQYDFVAVYNRDVKNQDHDDNDKPENIIEDVQELESVSDEIKDENLTDMNSDIEKWVEENKKEEEEEVPIPWTNPFMTLDDYLKSENPEVAYDKKSAGNVPVKKEFVKNKDEFSDDFAKNDPWNTQDYNDTSSGSKTKDEKFKEQMDLMKAEQRRKSRSTSSKTTNNENNKNNKKPKKKNEDDSVGGISSFINKLFGKK